MSDRMAIEIANQQEQQRRNRDRVRLEYRLPAETHNQFEGWQPNGLDRFPEDRAEQQRRNRDELAVKAKAGLIIRRKRSC